MSQGPETPHLHPAGWQPTGPFAVDDDPFGLAALLADTDERDKATPMMEDDRMHNTGRLGHYFDAERDVGRESLDSTDANAMFAVVNTRSPNTTMDTTHEDALDTDESGDKGPPSPLRGPMRGGKDSVVPAHAVGGSPQFGFAAAKREEVGGGWEFGRGPNLFNSKGPPRTRAKGPKKRSGDDTRDENMKRQALKEVAKAEEAQQKEFLMVIRSAR